MTLNDRIAKIITYSELSSSEFADEIEVQRSNISHITSGRNKPSLDFLVKIKEKFPELQWDWLIKGEGEMVKPKEEAKVQETKKSASLPDLFSLIDDDNFGITESEDRLQKKSSRESAAAVPSPVNNVLSDSQRLAEEENKTILQSTEKQTNKVKRIVWFYEDGKFESFEP